MGGITLQSRQSLSRRVQVFGGANGRGERRTELRRVFRFGDIYSDRGNVEAAVASIAAGAIDPNRNQHLIADLVDWATLYASDPVFARESYLKIVRLALDPEYEPNIDVWMQRRGRVPATPGTAPGIVTTPVPTPSASTPGMTNAEYQALLAAAQVEAARLAAMASANQAATVSEGKRILAEEALATEKAAAEEALRNGEATPPKSNPLPWLIAAGAAFFLLKG